MGFEGGCEVGFEGGCDVGLEGGCVVGLVGGCEVGLEGGWEVGLEGGCDVGLDSGGVDFADGGVAFAVGGVALGVGGVAFAAAGVALAEDSEVFSVELAFPKSPIANGRALTKESRRVGGAGTLGDDPPVLDVLDECDRTVFCAPSAASLGSSMRTDGGSLPPSPSLNVLLAGRAAACASADFAPDLERAEMLSERFGGMGLFCNDGVEAICGKTGRPP